MAGPEPEDAAVMRPFWSTVIVEAVYVPGVTAVSVTSTTIEELGPLSVSAILGPAVKTLSLVRFVSVESTTKELFMMGVAPPVL